MRARTTLVFLAIVALVAMSAPALAEPSDDARLACPEKFLRVETQDLGRKDCKSTTNQMELNKCLAHRRIQSEVSLRDALDLLLARLDAADRDRFRRTHAAWCAYRDAACDFDAPSGALGSMMPALRQQCRAARNMAKEKAVVTLSECIAHGNCENPHLFFVYEVGTGVD